MDQEYFKRLDENLGALKLGLERVENNLQSGLQRLDQRFSNVDQRFDMFEKNVEQHLDKLDLRMDSTTQRLDALFLQHGEINKWLIAMVITIILGVMGLATGLLPVR